MAKKKNIKNDSVGKALNVTIPIGVIIGIVLGMLLSFAFSNFIYLAGGAIVGLVLGLFMVSFMETNKK